MISVGSAQTILLSAYPIGYGYEEPSDAHKCAQWKRSHRHADISGIATSITLLGRCCSNAPKL